jgi:hypothetical protein
MSKGLLRRVCRRTRVKAIPTMLRQAQHDTPFDVFYLFGWLLLAQAMETTQPPDNVSRINTNYFTIWKAGC